MSAIYAPLWVKLWAPDSANVKGLKTFLLAYIIKCRGYMLYIKYMSSAIVWLQNAFYWKNSPWALSRKKTKLDTVHFKRVNSYLLVLVIQGGEHGTRVGVGWRPFLVGRLEVAILLWGLVSATCTDVTRLCQLASRPPVAPSVVYSTRTYLASGMICSLSLFGRFLFMFEIERVD